MPMPTDTLVWIIASAIIKITYKGRMQAEVKAAQATETAEAESLKRQVVEARMAAMQAQIEPHFLFNTLANVRALVGAGAPQAPAVLDSLIAYLRAAVPRLDEARLRRLSHLRLWRHARRSARPARDAARRDTAEQTDEPELQGVVGHGLPVGAVGRLFHLLPVHHKTAVAPAPVAATVFEVGIAGQIVPGRLERSQGLGRQARPLLHGTRVQHGVSLLLNGGQKPVERHTRRKEMGAHGGSVCGRENHSPTSLPRAVCSGHCLTCTPP